MYEKIDKDLSSVLPTLHSLTGCDITSKVGTKKSALVANPEVYLRTFGKSSTLSTEEIRKAEEYLVHTLKNNMTLKDFVALRADIFNFSKECSHLNLPPTSCALLPHIKRSFYNSYTMTHILDQSLHTLDPKLYGFIMVDSRLQAEMTMSEINEQWTVVCKCTNCSRTTCPCRNHNVMCARFCGCKKRDQCKNPYN